jgi:hypothetical protein
MNLRVLNRVKKPKTRTPTTITATFVDVEVLQRRRRRRRRLLVLLRHLLLHFRQLRLHLVTRSISDQGGWKLLLLLLKAIQRLKQQLIAAVSSAEVMWMMMRVEVLRGLWLRCTRFCHQLAGGQLEHVGLVDHATTTTTTTVQSMTMKSNQVAVGPSNFLCCPKVNCTSFLQIYLPYQLDPV